MDLGFEQMFNMLDSVPRDPNKSMTVEVPYTASYQPPTTPTGGVIDNWADKFESFKSRPSLYNMDGYISPYSSNNWGGTSTMLQYISDESRLPAVEQKIDPNKIFSAEINALRGLQADQQRIVKAFEKKLSESLNEKGKIGLTEEDIEAMSALTAARSAITAMTKEQVGIRKNIADIRLKQQMNRESASSGSSSNSGGSMKGMGSVEIGRSILDNIFDAPGVSYPAPDSVPLQSYPTSDINKANQVIDALIGDVNPSVTYESSEPTTYVVVGDTDDDVELVTYGANGDVIPGYPVSDNVKIESIDRDAKKALDQYMVEYPVKFKE